MEFRGEAMNKREFKSKNLDAERRRRRKLSDRLLALRALVPIITNMNKVTIIEDAITYIQELQRTSKILSDQLLDMDGLISCREGEAEPLPVETNNSSEDTQNFEIKEEVHVSNIDGGKLLIKIVFKKKRGRFTKLVEAMTHLGVELCEICATTCNGAMLVSFCVQVNCDDTVAVQVEQAKEFLSGIVRDM